MIRAATFNVLDWARVGDWDNYLMQTFPPGGERLMIDDHNFLQTICVRKAPYKVFEKYINIVEKQINCINYKKENPLHLLLGPDYFQQFGSVNYAIYQDDIINVIVLLTKLNENLVNQKNSKGQLPVDVSIKYKRNLSVAIVQLLTDRTKITTTTQYDDEDLTPCMGFCFC